MSWENLNLSIKLVLNKDYQSRKEERSLSSSLELPKTPHD